MDSATTRSHLVGLLLGTENDWPVALRVSRARPRTGHRTATACGTRSRPSGSPSSRSPARPAASGPRHRPARVLVLRAARVVEEGLPDGRRLPAQQPVHVPVHGEALGLLRDDAAGAEDPRDRAGPVQEPARPRQVRLHRRALQPALRPGRDRRGAGLPDVHEALRRRRAGAASRASTGRTTCSAAYDDSGEMLMHLQAVRSRTTSSPGRCPSDRRRWSCTSCPTSRCTPGTPSTTTSSQPRPASECVTINRTVNAFFRGSSTPARCSSGASARTAHPTRSTRSTTPTPARTSRSPRCTTTSRGR